MAPSTRFESDSQDASPLAQPLQFAFSGKSAPNRFLKGAMTERISSWDPENHEVRGVPSSNLVNLYRRWGEGGIGLILSGNIMFEYDHLEAAGNPIIPRGSPFSGERFERFKAMATEAKKHGSLFVAQVSHPGRQVEQRIQKNPVSASDVQLEGDVMGMRFAKPRAATTEDIANIIEGFAHAAEYLDKAGYDGIELHGAHGYLIAQFLSPTTNKRTDGYGGSIENRARLIVEITAAIRERVRKDFIVGIKLNSVEFQDQGFNPDEARQICAILEQNRFDFVELSGGTYEKLAFGHKRESTKKREGFFLEFAEAICPILTQTKTYITGGFKTVGAMTQALSIVDGIGLARPLAQEPRLCKDMLEGRVTGAIKQIIPDEDFGMGNVAAGTQMREIGKDHEPLDLSIQANYDGFMKDVQAWGAKMAGDETVKNYGYVDIESLDTTPYGAGAGAA